MAIFCEKGFEGIPLEAFLIFWKCACALVKHTEAA
jgi:hypothetical protein